MKRPLIVASLLAVALIGAPAAAVRDTTTVSADDVRTGVTLATATQLNAARALGARIDWDTYYGTPRRIHNPGGVLAGPRSGTAVEIAQSFVDSHRDLFAIDPAALVLVRDHTLPGVGDHIVTLNQTVAGLTGLQAGRLNVIVGADGSIVSVNGRTFRSGPLAAGFALTSAQALSQVASYLPELIGTELDFEVFSAGPFADVQRVRKGVFAVAGGLRPAYQMILVKRLDDAESVVVDGVTGAVLFRKSLVAHELPGPEGTVYPHFPGAPKGGQPVIKPFTGWVDGVTLFGNNADTFANYSFGLTPTDRVNRPVSVTAQFNYAYADNWGRSNGSPESYVLDRDPATTNLFYHHNRIHDEYYQLGFTETGGNFQVSNGTKGGLGGDPVTGLAHAGALTGGAPTYLGRDNAYMLTLPDGLPSWSGMYLWEPINDAFEGKYRDGNFDASVIQHEYSHGLSNRYVAGGEGTISPLASEQSGAMGEGWGDWYALDYLHRNGLETKAVVGEYVTGNASRGIRNWAYDKSPLTYGDYGYDLTGPEVHADGEIWTAVLWDLRQAVGSVTRQLVTDAMARSPINPSFLDMRDAILESDVRRYHGSHTDAIWTVFARRGMGASATTTSGDDHDPVPGFDHPVLSRDGSLSGLVLNSSTGMPISGARIIVGSYEARVTPATLSAANGRFGLSMVDGAYTVTIQAPGFGARSFPVSIAAGSNRKLVFKLAPNLASRSAGGSIVAASSQRDGLPAQHLIDDTEASVWSTTSPSGYVTIKLAKRASVKEIQVSAYKNTTDSRFAALRDFTFQVSTDGVLFKTVRTGQFAYEAPRPVAPDLHLRKFTLDTPADATYVRFYLDSVQGETMTFGQAAEVQVFSNVSGVEPDPGNGTLPPVSETGTIVAGTPVDPTVASLSGVYPGVTGGTLQQTCAAPPVTQGMDAWVTKVPDGYSDGTHNVSAVGEGDLYDLDLYFFDASCKLVGWKATAAANESAPIPGGVVYVVTQLYLGANVPVTVRLS